MPTPFHAVVLAAQRGRRINSLAEAAGVSHKCLIPLEGDSLIGHTLKTLAASPEIGTITVVIDCISALSADRQVNRLINEGRLHIVRAGDNLFDSVKAALEGEGALFPVLVTTADNVLLTPAMIEHFTNDFVRSGADTAVALCEKSVVQSRYPDGQRNFHRFADGLFCNCNLYGLNSAQAVAAAEIFAGGGQFAKKRSRVLRAFGLRNAVNYLRAAHDRRESVSRVAARFGLTARVVDMPFAEAPIDVDNQRTLRIAGEILHIRAMRGQ